jgi:hypothetical protein
LEKFPCEKKDNRKPNKNGIVEFLLHAAPDTHSSFQRQADNRQLPFG